MADRSWIVVPCFNEADRLNTAAFEAAMAKPDAPFFLFVDDGSTDPTPRLLQRLRARCAGRCEVLVLPRNRGKSEAVRQGMRTALASGAASVGYWDADLATPLQVIRTFSTELAARPGIQIIMGARVRLLGREIQRTRSRHLIGRLYATLASLVLRLPVYDTQCGAKLFRASPALEAALDRPFGSRWAFDVELLQRLQRAWGHSGMRSILEVPLTHWHDVGESKVSVRAGAGAFLFLLKLWLRPPPRSDVRTTLLREAQTEPVAARGAE